MTIGKHLDQLRRRLFWALGGWIAATGICLYYGKTAMGYLAGPLMYALEANGLPAQLYTGSVAEAFHIYLKVSGYLGLALSSPWLWWQLWQFVASGLYQREKRYVQIFGVSSALLFIAGACFFFFFAAPLCCEYFVRFTNSIALPETRVAFMGALPPAAAAEALHANRQLIPLITLENYLGLIVPLCLAFGVSFQLPLVIVFLGRIGLISLATLGRARRYVILIILFIAGILTPPDMVSQIALAIPMYLLYEAAVLALWLMERGKK